MTNDSQPRQAIRPESPGFDRRTFLRRAAIGAGAVGAVALVPALATDPGAVPETAATIDRPQSSGPVVVYVRDAARGEAVIIAGETESVVTDRALVSQLLRAQSRHLA